MRSQSGMSPLPGPERVPQRPLLASQPKAVRLPRSPFRWPSRFSFSRLVGLSVGRLVFFLSCWGESHIKKVTILKWSAFNTPTVLCNHHLYLVPKHFHPPKGNPGFRLSLHNPRLESQVTPDLCSISMNLPVLDSSYINEIPYMIFHVWFLSPGIMFSRLSILWLNSVFHYMDIP